MTTLQETLETLFGTPTDSIVSSKRDAILGAAIKVFAECGYHQTDVQDIANKAGVGKGTVYRHFFSKEYLFWAATVWAGERLYARSQPIVEGDADCIAKLRQLAHVRADFFAENPEVLELSAWQRAMFRGTIPPEIHGYAYKHFYEPFHRVVTEGVAQGYGIVGDIDLFVFSLISAIHGALMSYCYVKERVTLHSHISCAFEPILRSVLCPR